MSAASPLPGDTAPSSDDWKAIFALLDAALELRADETEAWLASLAPEQARHADAVRALLDSRAAIETADFLRKPADARLDTPGDSAGARPAAESPGAFSGKLVGPYRLVREIGQGGSASVWLAARADGLLERTVALKLPHLSWSGPAFAERLARERSILASLTHPNIARLYDAGVDAHGRPWLALEYVDGQPIDSHARSRGLATRPRVELLLQAARGVGHAHSQLVVHRDLKPSNILVDAHGRVHLVDFGIARLVELPSAGPSSASTLTVTAGRALTPDYASPEQIRGEVIGTASDVYSLGVVAYELLAGRRPYRLDPRLGTTGLADEIGRVDVATPSSAVVGNPDLRRSLGGDLDAIVLRALAKAPAARYPTIDAFADDLQRHLDGAPVVARPPSTRYVLGRWMRRHRVETGIAVALLLAVLGGAYATALVAVAVGAGALVALWQRNRALREADRARAAMERAEQVKAFIASIFTQAVPRAGKGGPVAAAELLQAAALRVETDLAGQPQVAAELGALIGASLNELGEMRAGLDWLPKAAALCSRELGPTHRLTLQTRHRWIEAANTIGELDASEPLLQPLLDDLRVVRPAEPQLLVRTLQSQAFVHTKRGREVEAMAALREAVEVATRELGEASSDALSARSSLSNTCIHFGRAAEALEAVEPALAPVFLTYGGQRPHPMLSMVERCHADALILNQRPREAAAILAQVLADQRALDAVETTRVRVMLSTVGKAALARGRFAEAEAVYAEADAMHRRLTGGRNDEGASLAAWRALVAVQRGDGEAALAHLQRCDALMAGRGEALSTRASRDATEALALATVGRSADALALLDAMAADGGRGVGAVAVRATRARAVVLRTTARLDEARRVAETCLADVDTDPLAPALDLGFVALEARCACAALGDAASAESHAARAAAIWERGQVDAPELRALLSNRSDASPNPT